MPVTPTGTPILISALATQVANLITALSYAGVNIGTANATPTDTGVTDTFNNSLAGRVKDTGDTMTGALTLSATGTGLIVAHAMSVGGSATLTGGFTATAANVVGKISGADSSFILGAASSKTYSGAASAAQSSFLSQHILRGTVSSGSQSYAQFLITDDGAVAPASNGQIAIVSVQDTLTANALGNRWGVDIGVANAAALSGAAGMGGIRAQVAPAFNMGGTDTTISGSLGSNFGGNITATAIGTATNLRTVTGMEIDVSVASGASTYSKIGLAIVLLANDAVQGAVHDYGISIQSQVGQSSGVGFRTGLVFGGNGGFGVASTGTLIGATAGVGALQAGIGVDWSGVTFSGFSLKMPGFTVDGSGNITATSYKVGANQVVGARDTGWTAMTGTPDKATTYATSTVTLAQLAGRVAELQAILTAHGLIGT